MWFYTKRAYGWFSDQQVEGYLVKSNPSQLVVMKDLHRTILFNIKNPKSVCDKQTFFSYNLSNIPQLCCATVAELVDASDLRSDGQRCLCGFESHQWYKTICSHIKNNHIYIFIDIFVLLLVQSPMLCGETRFVIPEDVQSRRYSTTASVWVFQTWDVGSIPVTCTQKICLHNLVYYRFENLFSNRMVQHNRIRFLWSHSSVG